MNWFSPICSFLQAAFLKLSKVDGKDGLSPDDFDGAITLVKNVEASWQDTKSGGQKADLVAAALGIRHGESISSWSVGILVWLAHSYAKRKGMLK